MWSVSLIVSYFTNISSFFSQNRVDYERRVKEQALRYRDPSL